MSCLIAFHKFPGTCPFEIGETLCRVIAKAIYLVICLDVALVCGSGLCARLKLELRGLIKP